MSSLKAKKIFIVDDDAMLTNALSDYLTREVNHDVHCFATGEACLDHMSENPEVIILDYYLNTVEKSAANGMEILKAIKKTHPFVQIIMLSSQERYGVALQTIQKGAEQYIIKHKDSFKEIAAIINEK